MLQHGRYLSSWSNKVLRVGRFPFCSIQFEMIRFYLAETFPLQCCRSPLPPQRVIWTLPRWLLHCFYEELARSLPLSFPSFPHFRRWPIARFAGHTCRHAFPIGDILAGRQGTSFSAPRDPSPTAAVDHAVSASRTPDLNARPRRGEPRPAPEPLDYRSRTRPGHLKAFPASIPSTLYGLREFLLLPSPPPPRRTPGGSGASRPAPSRKLPPEPAQAPGRTFLPGRRSERGAVDGRCRPRSSVTLPSALLPAKTRLSRGFAPAESACPWSFKLPFQVENKKKMHLDFPRTSLRF